MSSAVTIMYFCYGPQALFDQTLYSILSLMHVCGGAPRDVHVVVYTDRPDAFATLPVETVETGAATLDRWLGGSDYIHRRKTCAFIDALERFGGRVIFIDSDTYWLRPPTRLSGRIGADRACFHVCEGYLASTGTPFDDALRAQLASGDYRLRSGAPVVVDRAMRMWNTGVVGIDAVDIDRVREALVLSDALWAGADPDGPYGKKIHHAEQFAMGYAFRQAQLSEAIDCVYHYWRPAAKAEFGAVLPDLVRSGLADLSPANLASLYARRYRERGPDVMKDRLKMQVRRLALACGAPVRGVRRSVG